MDEQTIPLLDTDETAPGVDADEIDAGVIDDDWNSEPEDKLGAEDQDEGDGPERGSDDDDALAGDAIADDDAGAMMDSGGANQSFSLKHLSEVRTVGRDEIITLAQKGLDYDRIRGKYDEANAALSKSDDAYSLLGELAQLQGVTAEQLIDATRAQLLAQRQGIPLTTAAERVLSMRASKNSLQARTSDDAEKRQAEIREFLTEYGTGVDPKSIPPEVWQLVAKGKTLLGAYQAWELKKLRSESKAAQKNRENKSRSAGSRFTFGNQKPRDAIADDWYDS